jgi:plasmid replication initiation protein
MKDDGASMEAPIFSLSTNKGDTSTWSWKSKGRSVDVYPSVKGRATQFDKDVVIFVISQMTEALNDKRDDAKNRTARFAVYDYLVLTNKPTGGSQYRQFEDSLDRLAGTRIKTNIKTGRKVIKENFGIIDKWKIVEKSPDDRVTLVEVTLSEWLFNAVQAREVLTIHSDYFRLRKPLERRLYELARKHCGHKSQFTIGLDLLREKCGSSCKKQHVSNSTPRELQSQQRELQREFRRQLLAIIHAKVLPQYLISYNRDKDQVTFINKKVLGCG